MTTEHVMPADRRIAEIDIEIRALEEQAEEVARGGTGIDDPRFSEIDTQLAKLQSDLARLRLIRTAQHNAATQAALAARKEAAQAAHDQCLRIVRERIQLAAKIDEAIAALGRLLAQWDQEGTLARAEAFDIAGWLDGRSNLLLNAASGDFGTVLDGQLLRHGIGSVGIRSPAVVDVTRRSASVFTLQEAAQDAADRAKTYAANALNLVLGAES